MGSKDINFGADATFSRKRRAEETVCSMIALITSNPDLQAYATHKLYVTLAANTTQPVLLQLAVWCVGV